MLKIVLVLAFTLVVLPPTADDRHQVGKIDAEADELAAELIGAPVFCNDGVRFGQVADVILDEQNRPERLRITIGSVLGFGAREVEISTGTFTVLRGAVILDLSAEDVPKLGETVECER